MVRRVTRFALALVALAVLLGASDQRNAATWYNRAFDQMGRLTLDEWAVARAAVADPAAPPTPQVREILAKITPALDLARRGSLQGHADYGLDWSQGLNLVLPHLGNGRALSTLMKLDAITRLHDGDAAGASERIATMYRMARHPGNDGVLVSALVGQAVFRQADGAARFGFDRAAFGAVEATAMLRGLDTLSGPDPFGAVEGVVGEQALTVDWFAERFGDADARAGMMDALLWGDTGDPNVAAMAEMSDEAFAAELAAYDQLMDRAIAAFTDPDREAGRAELAQLDAELAAGEHGPLAGLMMPKVSVIFDLVVESEARVAERRTLLRGLVHGAIDPETRTNAALDYARAIEMLSKIDGARLDALRAFARAPRGAASDEVVETLAAAADIVDLLRATSTKEHCDFAALRPLRAYPLCPGYVPGMWDLLLLLVADARRHENAIADGKPAAADALVDRLAVAHRVIAHLSGDDLLLGPRVAHSAFALVDGATERGIAAGWLDDDRRAVLRPAARTMGRKDPFGYVGAVVRSRDRVASLLYASLVGLERDNDLRADLKAAVKTWDGDEMLLYLAVRDAMAAATSGPPAVDPLVRLDGVIDLAALETIRDSVPAVAPRFARGDLKVFTASGLPAFGRFTEHRRAARADLRRALARLRPAERAE
jgi:hypothetical protein